MQSFRSPAGLAVLSLSLLLVVACQLPALCAQSAFNVLTPLALYDFEGPVVGAGYSYTPALSALQSWTWLPNQGGVAGQGGPFDPPGSNVPPHNAQYAFIQTSPGGGANLRTAVMNATLTGLSTTATYYVTFYVGVRLGGGVGQVAPNASQSTVFLSYGSQTLWTSVNNISDSNGYLFVQTSTFTPATTQANFAFTVVSQTDQDHSILIDAVIIWPTAAQPNATLAVGTLADFEQPPIEGTYDYSSLVWFNQPWSFTPGQSGRAKTGGPFDPPSPTAAPSGSQYAFIQTAPNNNNLTTASMSAVLSGLSSSASYSMSFWWAVRSYTGQGEPEGGSNSQSTFSVLINGQVVYQSANNVSDAGGWAYVQTAPWQPSSLSNGNQATVQFFVSATSQHDHTILFDSILVQLAAAAGYISLPTLIDFESPPTNSFSSNTYTYGPAVTATQPFVWTPGQGGIARTGGPFDPPPPVAAPSNVQYAFIQTSPGGAGNQTAWMNATLYNLQAGATYSLSFYYGVRGATTTSDINSRGNTTQSQLTLFIGGVQVYQSAPNITDLGGWTGIAPVSFNGSGNAPIVFLVTSFGRDDHCLLIDAVQINVTLAPAPSSSSGSAVVIAPSSSAAAGAASSSSAAAVAASSSSAAAVVASSSAASRPSSSTAASSASVAVLSSSAAAVVPSSSSAAVVPAGTPSSSSTAAIRTQTSSTASSTAPRLFVTSSSSFVSSPTSTPPVVSSLSSSSSPSSSSSSVPPVIAANAASPNVAVSGVATTLAVAALALVAAMVL